MKIQNIDRAVVSPDKIKNYLLSLSHPVGRFKAIYFNKLGYSLDNWEILVDAFIDILHNNKPKKLIKTDFGVKYEVSGKINGKQNKKYKIITVWIIIKGTNYPKFITAYPGE